MKNYIKPNPRKQSIKLSRRDFTGAVAAFIFVPRSVLGGSRHIPPSEKLDVACIGVGGMGAVDVEQLNTENIVALCDVDWKHAADTFKHFPHAKKYRDYRRMLDD